MAHGANVTAYQAASVPQSGSCSSESRSCSDGALSGSFANQTCARQCDLPWGGSIDSGQSVTAYSSDSVPWGGDCATVAQTRTCSDGVLSGSSTHQSCSVTTPTCAADERVHPVTGVCRKLYDLWQGYGLIGNCGWNTSPTYCTPCVAGTPNCISASCWGGITFRGTCLDGYNCNGPD